MAVARERHRARNVTDFSAPLDRLSQPRLSFCQVGAMHPPRGGFFVGYFQETNEPSDERQAVTQSVPHLRCNATLRVAASTAWHGFRVWVRTRTGRCLHKMCKRDEENSGGEAPGCGNCSRSSDLKKSRSRIRLSISPSTLSLSHDDGRPVPYQP
jgi:hypothetical protein